MSEPELPGLPDEPPSEPSTAQLPPERHPFWGYTDLFVFIGLAVVSLAAGEIVVRVLLLLFHLNVQNDVVKLLPAQFLGYLFLFLLVRLMFQAKYGRPFWTSLGWTNARLKTSAIVAYGVLLAIAVGLLSVLLKTPEVPTPMSKLLADRTSVILVAFFGVTLGPLCEELIFRGFLQPLLVRSLSAMPGILLASVPFGLLHLQEYGYTWQPGLLIMLAGAAFGWMRHRTGSTKASTIMHAAYNGTFFLALLAQRKDLLHT
jgi:membrane protease YdiL (CAAX protease family)